MSTAKYLARYAAPEAAIASQVRETYDHVVVLPLANEAPRFLDGIAPAATRGRSLAIAVVNESADSSPEVSAQNRALLDTLGSPPPSNAPGWHLCGGVRPSLDLLVIDRARGERRLPSGQGVGLARRIGCDLALALIASRRAKTRWIHTTDADVTLPSGYFEATETVDAPAVCYRFWHHGSGGGEVSPELAIYELSLRYYVLSLRRARPRYAHHCLGSTIAVTADAYAIVRGFPTRTAGEDFYLMNKCAKLGRIAEPNSPPIEIEERPSDRVPFGTGPAVARYTRLRARGDEPLFYHPDLFELVGEIGHALAEFASTGSIAAIEGLSSSGVHRDAVATAIGALGLREAAISAADNTRSSSALLRRLDDWLDGFRTLKLIHHLRDAGIASIRWQDALTIADFANSPPTDVELPALRRSLFDLEQRDDKQLPAGLATSGVSRCVP